MPASRLSAVRKAVRPSLKGRMMIVGPSGSGKTRSSLVVASELAEDGPILYIDTEQESMLTYADDFAVDHLPWRPPFDPRELVEALAEAGPNYSVIVIDSFTHFWRKEGGVLDIANGKFTGWKEARPVHEAVIDAVLHSPAHIILAVRSHVEYTQEVENGKHVVKKLGMAAQQDSDLEYELNVVIELSMDHTATVSKSRTTALPVSRPYGPNRTAEMARIYRDWLKGGEPPAEAAVVKGIRERVSALPEALAKQCQDEFRSALCLPKYLRESQVPDAEALIAKYEAAVHPDGPVPADPPSDASPDRPPLAEQFDQALAASPTVPSTEDEICAQVEAMDYRTVVKELAARDKPTAGKVEALRPVLVEALLAERPYAEAS